ncbi:MAG: hypothetical protein WCG77_09415, partial [Actinomycetes bacterium]
GDELALIDEVGDELALIDEVGDELALIDEVGDELALIDVVGDALARTDARADAEGSSEGSVLTSASGLHCAGIPSGVTSDVGDAHAGVVPTSDAIIAITEMATRVRRMRSPRLPAFTTTPSRSKCRERGCDLHLAQLHHARAANRK